MELSDFEAKVQAAKTRTNDRHRARYAYARKCGFDSYEAMLMVNLTEASIDKLAAERAAQREKERKV